MSDPSEDLAARLLNEAVGASPALFACLVAQGRALRDDDGTARAAIRGRWPGLSEAETDLALRMAGNVLREIARESEAAAARLDALLGAPGHA